MHAAQRRGADEQQARTQQGRAALAELTRPEIVAKAAARSAPWRRARLVTSVCTVAWAVQIQAHNMPRAIWLAHAAGSAGGIAVVHCGGSRARRYIHSTMLLCRRAQTNVCADTLLRGY